MASVKVSWKLVEWCCHYDVISVFLSISLYKCLDGGVYAIFIDMNFPTPDSNLQPFSHKSNALPT